ncbi:hypothetical protein NC652_012946 [Populus alba x Populus x berolinensis]|nr:hypothetical protein NC652_012946 [Populus alba x Populus x berolinensis]
MGAGLRDRIIRQPISEQYEITREQVPIKMEQREWLQHAAARIPCARRNQRHTLIFGGFFSLRESKRIEISLNKKGGAVIYFSVLDPHLCNCISVSDVVSIQSFGGSCPNSLTKSTFEIIINCHEIGDDALIKVSIQSFGGSCPNSLTKSTFKVLFWEQILGMEMLYLQPSLILDFDSLPYNQSVFVALYVQLYNPTQGKDDV